MGYLLVASAGIDGVQLMADHCHGAPVIQAQRAGTGGGANVWSCGQDVQDAVKGHT
jgi:hypothetical protein